MKHPGHVLLFGASMFMLAAPLWADADAAGSKPEAQTAENGAAPEAAPTQRAESAKSKSKSKSKAKTEAKAKRAGAAERASQAKSVAPRPAERSTPAVATRSTRAPGAASNLQTDRASSRQADPDRASSALQTAGGGEPSPPSRSTTPMDAARADSPARGRASSRSRVASARIAADRARAAAASSPGARSAPSSRAAANAAPPADDADPPARSGRRRRGAPGDPGGKKSISLDEFLVEGQLEKPSAYYILRRSQLEHDWARLDARFSPLVLESVQDPLF